MAEKTDWCLSCNSLVREKVKCPYCGMESNKYTDGYDDGGYPACCTRACIEWNEKHEPKSVTVEAGGYKGVFSDIEYLEMLKNELKQCNSWLVTFSKPCKGLVSVSDKDRNVMKKAIKWLEEKISKLELKIEESNA